MKGTRWNSSFKGKSPSLSDLKLPNLESIDAGTYLPKLPNEFFDDFCQSPSYSITELTNEASKKFEEYRMHACKELEDVVSQKQAQLVEKMKQIYEEIDSRIEAMRLQNVSKVKEKNSQPDEDTAFEKRPMNDPSMLTRPQGALGASLSRSTNGAHFPVPAPAKKEATEAALSPQKPVLSMEQKNLMKPSHKVQFAAEEDEEIEPEEAYGDVFDIDEDLQPLDSSAIPVVNTTLVEDPAEERIIKDESVDLLHSGIATSFSAIPQSQVQMSRQDPFGDSNLLEPFDMQDLDSNTRFMTTRRDQHQSTIERHDPDEDLALVGAAMAYAPSHRHSLAYQGAMRLEERRATAQRVRGSAKSSKLAQSVPSKGAVQILNVGPSSDAKEGLDREPKTSVPYNEKLLVPSLLKAMRGRQGRQDSLSPSFPPAKHGNIRKTGFRIASSTHASPSRVTPSANLTTQMNDLPPLPDVPSRHIRLEPSASLLPHAVFGTEHLTEQEDSKAISKLLYFAHYLQNLKLSKRTGWYHHNVPSPESIADHMYRMAALSILIESDKVDYRKCVVMSLVHDMAEALVGDLTPLCKVEKEDKRRREVHAIHFLTHDLLGGSKASRRIFELWHEYEERRTPEAKLVKDLDCFELCLQAYEYERTHDIMDLQPFWDGAASKVSSPEVQRWMGALLKKREAMWTSRGVSYRAETRLGATERQVE